MILWFAINHQVHGRVQPGPGTRYPDGLKPDWVYDGVWGWSAWIGINYCFKTKKTTFETPDIRHLDSELWSRLLPNQISSVSCRHFSTFYYAINKTVFLWFDDLHKIVHLMIWKISKNHRKSLLYDFLRFKSLVG